MEMRMKGLFTDWLERAKNEKKSYQQMALELNVQLRVLEDRFRVIIEREVRALRKSRSKGIDNPRSISKIKNAYYCLTVLEKAKDELQDIETSAQLAQCMNEMGSALNTLNRLFGKSEPVKTSFINRAIDKMNGNSGKRDGGMSNVFPKSLNELVDDDIIERLVKGDTVQACMESDHNFADISAPLNVNDIHASDMDLEKELSETMAFLASMDN